MSRVRVIDLEKRVDELEAEAEKTRDILAYLSAIIKELEK
jgi:hypothetical protein